MLNNKTYWSIVIAFALLAVSVHAGNFTLNFTDSTNGTYISGATVNITYSFFQGIATSSTQEGGLSNGSYNLTNISSTGYGYVNWSLPVGYTSHVFQCSAGIYSIGFVGVTNSSSLYNNYSQGYFGSYFTSRFTSSVASSACGYYTDPSTTTSLFSSSSTSGAVAVGSQPATYYKDNDYSTASAYNATGGFWFDITGGSTERMKVYDSGVYWTVNKSFTNTSIPIMTSINNNWSVFGNIELTISAPGYITKYVNVTNVTSNYTTTLTPSTFTIYVYNENTQTIISGVNITGYIIGTGYAANFTTSSGSVNLTGMLSGNYQLVVGTNGYATRTYYFYYSGSSSRTVYLLPVTYSGVVLMDVDQSYNSLVGYQNSLLRQNTTGTYFEVERCTSDSNGKCIVSTYPVCTTNDTSCPIYRVVIYDPSNNTVGDTGPLRFSDNQYTLLINPVNSLQTSNNFFGLGQYFTPIDATYGITTYYFDNTNNVASSVTITFVRRVGSSYTTLETLTSSSSGLIVLTTTSQNLSLGDEFIASAVWTDNQGYVHQGDRVSYIPPGSGLGSSKGGILPFLFLGIVLAPLLLFDLNPPLAVGGTAALLYVSNLIGLASLTTNVIGGIIVLGGVVLWLVFK